MTRLTPPVPNEVFFDRHTDPATHVALTATARAVRAGTHISIRARVSFGPGVGPHETDDPATLRRWAWILHHTADAMDAHATTPADEPDPQLTLADAPLAAGHTPTIRIGACS